MSYQDVTQDQVMAAVLLRLRSALSLKETNCYEVEHPELAPEVIFGDIMLTVCPGDGDFPIDEQAGPQLAENSDVTVTWFTKIQLDRQQKVKNMLHEAERGILPWKARILRCMLPTAATGGNEILLPSGSRFLRDQIFVKRYNRANWDKDKQVAWASLIFGVNFDWDLTSV